MGCVNCTLAVNDNDNDNDAETEETPPYATPTLTNGVIRLLKKKDKKGKAVKIDCGLPAKAISDPSPSPSSVSHAVEEAVENDCADAETNHNATAAEELVEPDDGVQADAEYYDDDDGLPNNNNETETSGTEQVSHDDDVNDVGGELSDDEWETIDSAMHEWATFEDNATNATQPPSLNITELIKEREESYRRKAKEIANKTSMAIEDKAKKSYEYDPLYPFSPFGLDEEMAGIRRHVWDMVFVHVNDLVAIINLRECCTMFRDLLERKYVAAMLPEVVVYCLEQKFIPWNSIWGSSRTEKSNWLETLQSLRFVSKATENAVDIQFDRGMLGQWYGGYEHEWLWIHTSPDFRNYTTEEWKIPTLMLGALDVEQARLQRILDWLKTDKASVDTSSFSMRTLVFNEFRPDGLPVDLQDIRIAFHKCLRKIGNKITSFRYKTEENPLNVFNNLKLWLAEMPNLKELMVEFAGGRDIMNHYENVGSFVACPKLKRFAEGRHGFGYPFISEILRANPTLEEVLLGHMPSTEVETNDLNQVLDTLNITKFHSTWMPSIPFFEYRFQWADQLTSFSLLDKRSLVTPQEMIPSDKVFAFISQFKNLTCLVIPTPCIRDTGGTLDLPQLTQLMWKVHPDFRSLEFFNPAENLKWLWLDLSSCLQFQEENGEKEEVTLTYLNIELFPALKRIGVKTESDGIYQTIWESFK